MFFLASEAFSTLSVFKKSGTIFLYVTIGLLALIAVIGVLIWRYKKDRLNDFAKYAIGAGMGYSLAVIAIMLFLKFDEMVAEGEFVGEVFWPVFSLLCLAVALIVGGLIVSVLKSEYLKKYTFLSIVVAVVATLGIVIVQLAKLYKDNFVLADELILIFSILALSAILTVTLIFLGKRTLPQNSTKAVVYAAICIAISFALSYIRFFRLPQGGSITFVSLLPLMFYSYIFGIRKGVLAGFIYGLLQAIQDPWLLHPIQFLLDYPFAFAMVGLAGMFRYTPIFKNNIIGKFLLGAAVSAVLRYASHVISGAIIFGSANENFNAIEWSLFYNLFVFADAAIAVFAGSIMLSSKNFVNQIENINVNY